jgi:hypothetical protein
MIHDISSKYDDGKLHPEKCKPSSEGRSKEPGWHTWSVILFLTSKPILMSI